MWRGPRNVPRNALFWIDNPIAQNELMQPNNYCMWWKVPYHQPSEEGRWPRAIELLWLWPNTIDTGKTSLVDSWSKIKFKYVLCSQIAYILATNTEIMMKFASLLTATQFGIFLHFMLVVVNCVKHKRAFCGQLNVSRFCPMQIGKNVTIACCNSLSSKTANSPLGWPKASFRRLAPSLWELRHEDGDADFDLSVSV